MGFEDAANDDDKQKLVGHQKIEEQLAGDCIINLRTIASFGQNEFIIERYAQYMEESHKEKMGRSHKFGLSFGYSQFIQYAVFGALYYAGAEFMERY